VLLDAVLWDIRHPVELAPCHEEHVLGGIEGVGLIRDAAYEIGRHRTVISIEQVAEPDFVFWAVHRWSQSTLLPGLCPACGCPYHFA
jgi:hypothetical protein